MRFVSPRSSILAPALFVIFLNEGLALAQDQCVALIQNGLYNTYRSESGNANLSQVQSQFCSDYNSYKQTGLTGNLSVSYGLFSGSASASQNQIDAVAAAVCSSNFSYSSANAMLNTFSSVVDPSITEAFTNCVNATNQGLIYKLTPSPADANTLSIDVHYQAIGASSPQRVNSVTINQDAGLTNIQSVACRGPLFTRGNQNGGVTLDSNVLSMTCTRSGQGVTGFSYMGQQVYAAPVRVAVNTNIGGIVADMPLIPVSKPAPPRSFFPIGTILLFSGKVSDIPTGWHICDGTNGTVDLRNRFPYGAATDDQLGKVEGLPVHHHEYDGGATTETVITGFGPDTSIAFNCCKGDNLKYHQHKYSGGTTKDASSIPPATRVYFIQKIH